MNLSTEIFEILKEIDNVYESWYRQNLDKTHLVFQEIEEKPQFYSDGSYAEIEHTFQFDVFGDDENEVYAMKEAVKECLKEAGFIWQGTRYEHLREIDYFHNTSKYICTEVL